MFIFRLHEELRRSIENQLDALQQVEGISGDNQDSIDTMQRQLRLLGQVTHHNSLYRYESIKNARWLKKS